MVGLRPTMAAMVRAPDYYKESLKAEKGDIGPGQRPAHPSPHSKQENETPLCSPSPWCRRRAELIQSDGTYDRGPET